MASRSAGELAAKFQKYAAVIPDTNAKAVGQSAQFAKEMMVRGAVAAGLRQGGALPKAGGARWGVRYDIRGAKNPTALVRYVGPVHWAFGGTEPHFMMASRYGNSRAGRRNVYANGRTTKQYGRSKRLSSLEAEVGANVAFGGSNRGRFAALAAKQANADAKRAGRGGRVRARKQALRTPQGLRAYAFHPGARGRNTWPTTKRLIEERSPVVFVHAHRSALIRAGFGQ